MRGVSAVEDVHGLARLCGRLPTLQSLSLDSYCYKEEAAGPLEEAVRCACGALEACHARTSLLPCPQGAVMAVACPPPCTNLNSECPSHAHPTGRRLR